MHLEDIGFYTLSEDRVINASCTSPLSRCELVLTSRCNFKCPYCRSVGGEDMDFKLASDIIWRWAADELRSIRFSGGEPTLYPELTSLCRLAGFLGIERIALSTNGSASIEVYGLLLSSGVNDFSVSLDACCASDGDRMSGGVKGAWDRVIRNIEWISSRSYTTVGIVLTDDNMDTVNDTIKLADSLGVSDIRIIPAAQSGNRFHNIDVDNKLLEKYPILRYRIANMKSEVPVRGLSQYDTPKCGLVLDDMAVNHDKHYPCIIYMRESGRAIGKVGPNMRLERLEWYKNHNTHYDKICKENCLDVCRTYNDKYENYHRTHE